MFKFADILDTEDGTLSCPRDLTHSDTEEEEKKAPPAFRSKRRLPQPDASSDGPCGGDTKQAKRARAERPAPKPQSQLRNFVFTLNNPRPNAALARTTLFGILPYKYLVIGVEGTEPGKTVHLQGYCELKSRTSFSKIQKLLPRAAIFPRKGKASQAADYCKKEGQFKEDGTISSPGKRTDIERIRDAVAKGKTLLEIMQEVDSAFRYVNAVKLYIAEYQNSCRPELKLTLRPWQATLVTTLTATPHPRKVLWYWDPKGATGKSTLARYLAFNHQAFLCNGGKYADIAYAYDKQRIVIFDLSRDMYERIPYALIECFKNGTLFSSKYQSTMLFFDIPHVVIFANYEPDRTKLSLDRWQINKIISV